MSRAAHSPLTRRLVREGCEPPRQDANGEIRLMAKAQGYVMVRRPGCVPFVMREQDWLRLQERAA